MNISFSFHNTIKSYKKIGIYSFYILPSIEINKDNVFDENCFVLELCWMYFNISIYLNKDDKGRR